MSTTLLRGKYRVLEAIGSGGMASVHAGVNVMTERPVAIKRLLMHTAGDAMVRARFEREARAAGRIQSPHVVQIIDIDHDESGAPFLVMERLRGESLGDRLKREGRLPPLEAIDVARQLLTGIAAAHRAGVVHRDLKPGNVFLEKDGPDKSVVKIVDFGISKIHDNDARELTRDGEALGTFSYMPPEQIRHVSAVGPEADLWAIGVILFRMLTGYLPFRADNSLALLALILEHPAERLEGAGLPAHVVEALEPVLLRVLEKDPAGRYRAAEAMLEDLEQAARRIAEVAPSSVAGGPGSAPVSALTNAPVSALTNAPVSALTSGPMSAPTSGPMSAPTSGPISAPTSGPYAPHALPQPAPEISAVQGSTLLSLTPLPTRPAGARSRLAAVIAVAAVAAVGGVAWLFAAGTRAPEEPAVFTPAVAPPAAASADRATVELPQAPAVLPAAVEPPAAPAFAKPASMAPARAAGSQASPPPLQASPPPPPKDAPKRPPVIRTAPY